MTVRKLDLKKILILCTIGTGLSGCSNDISDLHSYVQEAKANKNVKLDPLPTIKPHETYRYLAAGRRDPFQPFETAAVGPTVETIKGKGKGKGPKPIEGRAKELLESYPLDSLRMVGVLEIQGTRWALVSTNDGTIHRVRKNNYLGQNHGKIIDITENKVVLTEIVPDGLGDWIERPASLALIEDSKGGS